MAALQELKQTQDGRAEAASQVGGAESDPTPIASAMRGAAHLILVGDPPSTIIRHMQGYSRGFEVFKVYRLTAMVAASQRKKKRTKKPVHSLSCPEFAVARTVESGGKAGSLVKLSTDWSWMGFAHAATYTVDIAKWRWQPSSWRR